MVSQTEILMSDVFSFFLLFSFFSAFPDFAFFPSPPRPFGLNSSMLAQASGQKSSKASVTRLPQLGLGAFVKHLTEQMIGAQEVEDPNSACDPDNI
jgi:hypothetical protein